MFKNAGIPPDYFTGGIPAGEITNLKVIKFNFHRVKI